MDTDNHTVIMDILVTKNSITLAGVIALIGQEFDGTLEIGEVSYFVYNLPEEGMTLRVEILDGFVVIYISTKVRNPNEALYDFKLVTSTTTDVFIPPPKTDSPANDTTKVYISIEGHSTLNRFVLNTTYNDTTTPSGL